MDKTKETVGDAGIASTSRPELVNVAGASGIALDDYDPMAFFTDGKPMHGDLNISATHKGATYFVTSKDHKDKFESDPEAYVP